MNTQKKYPEKLRLVRFHDDEQDRDFAFLTNAFHLTALEIELKRSTYEVLQILSISLTDKTPLGDLFEKTNFNDVKELDYPLFEGLFD